MPWSHDDGCIGVTTCDRGWTIVVTEEDVLSAMGVDWAAPRVNRVIGDTAAEARRVGAPLIEPAVAWRAVALRSVEPDVAELATGARIAAPGIGARLAGSVEAVVAVCTVGARVEQEARDVRDADPLLGLALDAFGSAAVDALADAACDRLAHAAASRGWQLTAVSYPGLAGWDLGAGQRRVFDLVDAARIGVRLTSSAQMLPLKSVSLLAGMGPGVVSLPPGNCAGCDIEARCRHRRRGPRPGRSSGDGVERPLTPGLTCDEGARPAREGRRPSPRSGRSV